MFGTVLVANRGEIAGRIIRTLRKLGIRSVAIHSEADRFSPPVLAADEAVAIGQSPAARSYLNVEAILDACRRTGAEAVHPGYGFLSENPAFARALTREGIAFIGPRPEHLEAFGLKHEARAIAERCGVPLLPGSGLLGSVEEALAAAEGIGYPVMLKSVAGGGGIGMRLCADAGELAEVFGGVERSAQASFSDARVYLERFVTAARHVEAQIFGDGQGRVLVLGERDCSLQRRNQKVIEETPAPNLPEATRARLHAAARALGEAVAYESAGTVEFIYDVERDEASFLEVNTRLQVEHPVTEAVLGIDLVEWMIAQAAGTFAWPEQASLVPRGAAIETRIYAEAPHAGFRPSAGLLTEVRWPAGVRVDTWVETGTEVTPFYDPLIAKVVVAGATRDEAVRKLGEALDATALSGIATNLDYLRAVVASEPFRDGRVTTGVLGSFAFRPDLVEVIEPGAQTSLQDWPGRLGLWPVGVPPSGPMDERSFRLANRLTGNPDGAPALECTAVGPTLRFAADVTVALAGARMEATLDGEPVPNFASVEVRAGQVLRLGAVEGPGQRTYLAVAGGFDAPVVLGSRATFALGGFGGHATGPLKTGNVLRFARASGKGALAPEEAPALTHDWEIGVLYGPHGAPDFFRDEDIATLFSAPYEVHFNSARTGIRLIGPKPAWARPDGGEAGLHSSNIHDTPYAVGSLDFTGDMPIILGPDGPSLGGFVCPAVVVREEMWKLGQLKAGDTVRFRPVTRFGDPIGGPAIPGRGAETGSAVLGGRADGPVPVVYRRAGDDNLLVEYGPMTLDVALRLRVHLLEEALAEARLPGIVELTPGIRSLQVHYDGATLPRARLLDVLAGIEDGLPDAGTVAVPSRIVHLPLSWDDPSVRLATRRYQELVRPDAPWCPSNIEFIRRINGLASEDEVRRIVLDAAYLVLGLGDVYLGAPVATPVDPRQRLVTTKYNPARTWTPENAVGIGGAYLCVYGMEGPGGYQLLGRTIQMWNTWRTTEAFRPGTPWLLRPFDQIRFFPVSEAELAEARAAFPHGRYPIRIEETRFSHAEHRRAFAAHQEEIAAVKAGRQAAFDAERRRWREAGLDRVVADEPDAVPDGEALPPGCFGVSATVPGNLWKILVETGATVRAGDPVAIVESMKMEMPVAAAAGGRVRELRCRPGRAVRAGEIIAVLEEM